jgi:uncharacterized glyoxalase superfamily protein PhnB
MTTATDQALQAKSVMASLTVNDLQASIRFFEGLGFTISERWENEGKLLGVMLKAGDVEMGIGQDDWQKGRDRQKGAGFRLYINTTQDVDAIAARAKSNGITLDSEPHDTEWNSRVFEVTEPSGFKLTIARKK